MDKLLAEFEKLDDQVIVDWMANDFSLEAFDEVRESTLPEGKPSARDKLSLEFNYIKIRDYLSDLF